jgi:hypothetical protein
MIKRLMLAALLACAVAPATADTGILWVPLGYQQIAPTSSTAFTAPTGATMALLTAEVQAIRCRDDGVAPTTSVGFLIPVGVAPFQYSGTLSAMKCINAVSGGILNILYYR